MAGQEPADYDSKLVSLEQALAAIRPGSRIYLGTEIRGHRLSLLAIGRRLAVWFGGARPIERGPRASTAGSPVIDVPG